MIDVVLAREVRLRHRPRDGVQEAEMSVGVDDRGHDRLAGEVDARRARRQRDVTLTADARELVVLDDERAVVDRRAVVAGNQARAFEEHRSGSRTRLACRQIRAGEDEC